ncbi:hypothetical protein AADG42_13675 [Ammonicoccus fulvus]|uniref:Cell division protein FtsL n=1 Tax=Ammonicoccus fulvus TaxID=3138240 RepID=A0ABZ3FT83_9ACTN
MSALPVVSPDNRRDPSTTRLRRLRLVRPSRPRMGPVAFLTFLLGLVGVGMVGLLLLNTHLQNQAFQATELRRQAAEMSYAEGELTQLVIEAGSTRELTRKATELGLRPNRGIAFVELPSGNITGEPTADDGLFLPSSLTRSAEEMAQERAKEALTHAGERRQAEALVAEQHRERILEARAAAQAQAQAAQAPPADPAQPQAQSNGNQPPTGQQATGNQPPGQQQQAQPQPQPQEGAR